MSPDATDATARPRRHLAGGALVSTTVQIVTLAAATVTSVVIARRFGPGGTGTFALVVGLFGMATTVCSVGLQAGITYVASRGRWPLSTAIRESWKAALTYGLAGAALAVGAYYALRGTMLESVTLSMALLVSGALPFGLAWTFSTAVALAAERYEIYGAVVILQAVGGALFSVALCFPFGIAGAVVGFAASYVVVSIAALILLRRAAVSVEDSAEQREIAEAGRREARRFGLHSWGADLLQLLNYRLDLFILSAFAGRAAVGHYSVAVSLMALGWVLPTALHTVVFPRTANIDATVETNGGEGAGGVRDAELLALRHTVLLLVPTAIGLSLLLVIGVPVLYGSRFASTIGLGFVLLPGVLAIGFAKVLSAVISGRGHPIYSLYNAALTAPATLALYFVVIPHLGAYGAALVSTLSYAASTAIAMHYFKRVTGASAWGFLVPRRSDLRDYQDAWHNLRTYAAGMLERRAAR